MSRLASLLKLPMRGRPPVGKTPHDVVFTENKWRLLRYRRTTRANGPPVLLVPSLINRHYVLDLMPGKSFVEYLLEVGHDVFCLDWGTPADEDRFLDFDTLCDTYIRHAIARTARESGHAKAHLFGYCLGGTMATLFAIRRPERVLSLTLLAAPVHFEHAGVLSTWARRAEFDPGLLGRAFGNIPWPLLQATFHMIRPTLSLSKTMHFLDRVWDDEFVDGFFALETWGNDNVSLPGVFFEQMIRDLYQGDALMHGRVVLSGETIRLEDLRCPLHVVTFEHDNIVPKEAARALLEVASSSKKEWLHLAGGHVGAVVSRAARKNLWPKVSTFFREVAEPAPQCIVAPPPA